MRTRFNLVSFDPRGVGSSEPLQCLTPAEIGAYASLNPDPRTPKQVAAVVSATKDFVRGCKRSASTAFISTMSTANNARDMDRLRAALRQKRLTYFGFSYGTYLGTVYAELFPKRIRGMVLDGAVDPSLDGATADAGQAAGFETDLHDFFAWCAKDASCRSGLSPSPAKAYAALFARLKEGHTVSAVSHPHGMKSVDYGVALAGVLAALYSRETWPLLGQALASAESGDGSVLALLAYALNGVNPDGSFSNIVSANTATSCLDVSQPTTIREHEELARRLAKSSPNFGAAVAWTGLGCLYWPTRAPRHPSAAHAPGAPPILVIGSTGDPATPYAWAKALANQLPRATLLTRTGAGHTAYRASSCIRRWADRYLTTLKMPPAGTVCPTD
jgi:pimeloyl-ACP methyl ester carboxylesterase